MIGILFPISLQAQRLRVYTPIRTFISQKTEKSHPYNAGWTHRTARTAGGCRVDLISAGTCPGKRMVKSRTGGAVRPARPALNRGTALPRGQGDRPREILGGAGGHASPAALRPSRSPTPTESEGAHRPVEAADSSAAVEPAANTLRTRAQGHLRRAKGRGSRSELARPRAGGLQARGSGTRG